MSRTDKDAPWWVRSEWWVPKHWRCENSLRTYGREPRVCDLPAEPVRQDRPTPRPRRWLDLETCHWEAEWVRLDRYRYTRPPTRQEKHLDWWGPDRAQVRDLTYDARKQYRGSAEVEILRPEPGHHRHASKKGWWD